MWPALEMLPTSQSVSLEEPPMIGKITLAAALLVGATAFAQQTPGSTTPGAQNPSQNPPQNQMTGQCWDTATNQVRTRGTVGAGGNQPGGNQTGGARPNSPPNQPSG